MWQYSHINSVLQIKSSLQKLWETHTQWSYWRWRSNVIIEETSEKHRERDVQDWLMCDLGWGRGVMSVYKLHTEDPLLTTLFCRRFILSSHLYILHTYTPTHICLHILLRVCNGTVGIVFPLQYTENQFPSFIAGPHHTLFTPFSFSSLFQFKSKIEIQCTGA